MRSEYVQDIVEKAEEFGKETLVPASNTVIVKDVRSDAYLTRIYDGYVDMTEGASWTWDNGDMKITFPR